MPISSAKQWKKIYYRSNVTRTLSSYCAQCSNSSYLLTSQRAAALSTLLSLLVKKKTNQKNVHSMKKSRANLHPTVMDFQMTKASSFSSLFFSHMRDFKSPFWRTYSIFVRPRNFGCSWNVCNIGFLIFTHCSQYTMCVYHDMRLYKMGLFIRQFDFYTQHIFQNFDLNIC